MTKKEKELVLKDLSARFPYGIKCRLDYGKEYPADERYEDDEVFSIMNYEHGGLFELGLEWSDQAVYVEDIKPYLRPMSSMTEEEKKEYGEVVAAISLFDENETRVCPYLLPVEWLNKRHFDYRGLIDKKLALKAPEGTYE